MPIVTDASELFDDAGVSCFHHISVGVAHRITVRDVEDHHVEVAMGMRKLCADVKVSLGSLAAKVLLRPHLPPVLPLS